MTTKDKLVPVEPSLVAWVLYDATADKKYIKMDPTNGSLAIFDSEEAAISAKRAHPGTDYDRCEYYSAPQPVPAEHGKPVIRKLGIIGAAFDLPSIRRAYTYSDQPNNITAWKLGRVAYKERSGGDFIDYGLQLLQHLQDEGFGVFEIAESDPTPQPTTKCQGAGCTDQGCPAHYANDYPPTLLPALRQYRHNNGEGFVFGYDKEETDRIVAKLVEALEGLLAIVSDSSGVAGYHMNGDIAEWDEFVEVFLAEEALELYRKQGGGL